MTNRYSKHFRLTSHDHLLQILLQHKIALLSSTAHILSLITKKKFFLYKWIGSYHSDFLHFSFEIFQTLHLHYNIVINLPALYKTFWVRHLFAPSLGYNSVSIWLWFKKQKTKHKTKNKNKKKKKKKKNCLHAKVWRTTKELFSFGLIEICLFSSLNCQTM